jgi:hypothetical protein
MAPKGWMGLQIGETVFTCVYLGKIFQKIFTIRKPIFTRWRKILIKSFKNYLAKKIHIHMEILWHNVEWSVSKSQPWGRWGHNRRNHFKIFLQGKTLLKTIESEKIEFKWKKFLDIVQIQVYKIIYLSNVLWPQKGIQWIFIGKIFICGPSCLRWAMWPMGLLFYIRRGIICFNLHN